MPRKRKRKRKRKLSSAARAPHAAPHVVTPPAPAPHTVDRPPTPPVPKPSSGGHLENAAEAAMRALSVRSWATPRSNERYPEAGLPEVMTRPNVGVCFSGGGFRSAPASMGQMRALVALGLDTKLRYTTCNSGGAWATVSYTFLPAVISEARFFGEYLPPEKMRTWSDLRDNCRRSLYLNSIATNKRLWRYVAQAGVAALAIKFADVLDLIGEEIPREASVDEGWGRALGRTMLEPLGLFDSARVGGEHCMFTWSDLTRKMALAENPHLERGDFRIVERPRPFNIAVGAVAMENSLLLGATGRERLMGLSLFEMTPYYSGVPVPLPVAGGGYIESFGQDATVKELDLRRGRARVRHGRLLHRFTLSDVLGVTGSAFGLADRMLEQRFTPRLRHWPLLGSKPRTTEVNTIDGGYLDSQAIMPLLARKVPRIVAFVNGASPLGDTPGGLKASIRHLFGDSSNPSDDSVWCRKSNTVFAGGEAAMHALHRQLQASRGPDGRKPTYARGRYRVLANANYGIEPYEVEVLWVYLDRSLMWSTTIGRLAGDLDVANGAQEKRAREQLGRFPNSETFRIRPTAEELALLSNYGHWSVVQIRDEITRFVAGP